MKVVSININSLRGKSLQMLELIHSDQPDLILCQETKLDGSVSSSELFPASYSVFRKDRNLAGGGVCIAVSNKFQATQCHDLDNDLEAVWIQLHTSDHSPLYICSLYRPPDKGSEYIELLRTPLESLLKRHLNKPPSIVITGDVNYRLIDWSMASAPSLSDGGNLIDILNDYYLHQLVSSPTRFGKTTSSLLDLVMSSHPASITNLAVGREMSDHCLVEFNLLLSPLISHDVPRKVFQYNRGNYDQLRSDIRLFAATFSASHAESRTVDANWLDLKETLITSIQKNIPTKLVSNRNRKPSWLTPSVQRAIKKRDKLARLAKRTGSQINRDRYRKARNYATGKIHREYFDQLNSVIGNVDTNPRQFYRFIKYKRSDTIGISSLKSDGSIISDDKAKAACLNNYFASVFTIENTSNIPKLNASHPIMPDIEVTVQGVCKLLANIDAKKSTGPDELPPRVLKEVCNEISPVLTFIFNQSIKSGIVPDDWLVANIFALHKKGPKDLPENYRPISLTSICSKIVEHIIHSSICRFLEDNNILTPRQHGFRTHHSCESQLILAVDDWAKALDSGFRTDIAIFDFSKAFDSVPHQRLLRKIESYGIQGNTLKWISSFLSSRRQRVVINGSQSPWTSVISGVPQGTVLGPLLFLLYINDITDGIQSDIRLFADDCILYRVIKTSDDTSRLQEDIDRLHFWTKNWQMNFNTKKCHVLSISRKREKPVLTYKIGSEHLSEVDSYPYLGVTISCDLKWHLHIDNSCLKASRVLNFVRRNIYHCSPEAKALAYTSLVRPHLEYAASVWDPFMVGDSTRLEGVQRRAARFAKNDYSRTTSVTQLLNELGWSQLSERRRNARLSMLFKAIHGQIAIPIDSLRRPVRQTRYSGESAFTNISCRTDTYKYSFFPRTVVDWNALPVSTRLKPSVESFGRALHHQVGPPTSHV